MADILTRDLLSLYSKTVCVLFISCSNSPCRLLIALGVLWILFSLVNSILRANVLQLLVHDTTIDLIQPIGNR